MRRIRMRRRRARGGGRRQRPKGGSGTALLLIDVINDLSLAGSEAPVAQAEPMARRLAAFKRRAGAAGIATIYIKTLRPVALGLLQDRGALHLALPGSSRVAGVCDRPRATGNAVAPASAVDIEDMDGRILLEAQPHTLMIGDEDRAIDTCRLRALPRIADCRMAPSGTSERTALGHPGDPERRSSRAPQQRACLAWMDRTAAAVQVISIAARTVFHWCRHGRSCPMVRSPERFCLPLTRDAAALTVPVRRNAGRPVTSAPMRQLSRSRCFIAGYIRFS